MKPLILLVADNADDCRRLKEALELVGRPSSVLSVENAVQAISYLSGRAPFARRQMPALIVVDIHLPLINGFQLLELLGEDPEWRVIPAVVLSRKTSSEVLARARALGAKALLEIPRQLDEYGSIGRSIFAHLQPSA